MDNYDIIIYSDNINNRKKYVFSHIFNNYFSINPLITQNIEEFKISNLPKICYANQPINNVFYIKPQGLLDEFNKIQEKNLEVEYIDNIPTIFNTNNECNLGFDVFSAVFYLLSRYEEYTNKNFDRHGRFDESFSFFVKNNLHSEPLVDIWINYLGTKLSTIYPSLIKNESTFQYHPTIDIDDFYEIKGKSIAYTWLRLFKKLLFGKIKELKFFINVITNKKDDPYDSYDFLHFNLKNHFPTPVFFFHVGGKKSSYDNSNNYWSLSVKNKILSFLQHYQCGLHVSYNSNNNADRIKKEKFKLEKIVQKEIYKSRNHFIRIKIPDTYRRLIQIGITEDYSMGYPSINGFRAGTAHPFLWYDLENEQITNLMIYPFQAMDATYSYYLRMSRNEIINDIRSLMTKTKKYKGTFRIIWHNSTFTPYKSGDMWKEIFLTILKESSI